MLLGVAVGIAPAQQPAGAFPSAGVPEGQPFHLKSVASGAVFEHVNHDDARTVMKVWFDRLAKQRGVPVDSSVEILDGPGEIRRRLENHSAEILVLTVFEFLELERSHLVIPVLTNAFTTQGVAPFSYLVLVRPSSPVTSVADLRGKNLLAYSRGGSNTAGIWLDVLLSKESLGRAASFFASFQAAEKAQDCILSLFFGRVDACATDEISLNLAKEMNPQLAQLRVIARSRPMIASVIATPMEPFPYRSELIEAMLDFRKDPRGLQLLQLFKTESVVRLQPGDLDSARELFADYNRIRVPAEKRAAAPQPAGR
jgi:ABC-type phosphate/phosphonate transport system substrate-binding protein